jgi:hypothetical protein
MGKKWEYNETVFQLSINLKEPRIQLEGKYFYSILLRVFGTHETSKTDWNVFKWNI